MHHVRGYLSSFAQSAEQTLIIRTICRLYCVPLSIKLPKFVTSGHCDHIITILSQLLSKLLTNAVAINEQQPAGVRRSVNSAVGNGKVSRRLLPGGNEEPISHIWQFFYVVCYQRLVLIACVGDLSRLDPIA